MKKLHTKNAPDAIGPYSQAVIHHGLLFSSGQLGFDPKTMEFVDGGIKAQTKQALLNVKAILEEAGVSMDSVIKTVCFLSDIQNFVAFNEVYSEIFGTHAPARSCVEVSRLPKDALVEIEVIAKVG